MGDSYWLQPDGQVAAKPYKLLRDVLTRSDRAAIAKFAWHGRERLGDCKCWATRSPCTRCAGRTRSATPAGSLRPRPP
ncbi:Ku protein [Streptomyces thermolilacinus]